MTELPYIDCLLSNLVKSHALFSDSACRLVAYVDTAGAPPSTVAPILYSQRFHILYDQRLLHTPRDWVQVRIWPLPQNRPPQAIRRARTCLLRIHGTFIICSSDIAHCDGYRRQCTQIILHTPSYSLDWSLMLLFLGSLKASLFWTNTLYDCICAYITRRFLSAPDISL